MNHDPTNREGFERWARRQGMDLMPCPQDRLETDEGTPLPTYWINATEYAWRGWANRPHRETRVTIAGTWPTPERRAAFNPALAAPYGQTCQPDGGDMTAIREAAARASAVVKDLSVEPLHDETSATLHIAGIPVVENPTVPPGVLMGIDSHTLETCKARFPMPARPNVADTAVFAGSPPCENLAGENQRKALRVQLEAAYSALDAVQQYAEKCGHTVLKDLLASNGVQPR